MTTTPHQFEQWLDAPEGTNIEFKSAAGGYHFDKLVRYCVALANEGSGQIILGVTDRRPRTVTGTHAFPEPGRIEGGAISKAPPSDSCRGVFSRLDSHPHRACARTLARHRLEYQWQLSKTGRR